jgi:type IV secretory pathway VirB3-like protein
MKRGRNREGTFISKCLKRLNALFICILLIFEEKIRIARDMQNASIGLNALKKILNKRRIYGV